MRRQRLGFQHARIIWHSSEVFIGCLLVDGATHFAVCIAEESKEKKTEEAGQEGQRMPVCVCVGAHNRVRVRAFV
ncbi:hypothetical protein ACI65C_003785 [Semiaphis heraclei]